jgi:hypothetical protein
MPLETKFTRELASECRDAAKGLHGVAVIWQEERRM